MFRAHVELTFRTKSRDQGHALEWHVVLLNSFEYFTFEFVSGFHHSIVFLLPAFSLPWLKAIRPVGDSVSSDSVEQLLVEITPVCRVTVHHRLIRQFGAVPLMHYLYGDT